MEKKDLVAGVHVIETREDKYLVCGDYLLSKSGEFITLSEHSDYLVDREDDDFTVIRVYEVRNKRAFPHILGYNNLELVWERKQIPKLTEQEKTILKCLPDEYKYIARDSEDHGNDIYVYELEPVKGRFGDYYESKGRHNHISIFNSLFKSITFKNKPILISDLLND